MKIVVSIEVETVEEGTEALADSIVKLSEESNLFGVPYGPILIENIGGVIVGSIEIDAVEPGPDYPGDWVPVPPHTPGD